MKYQLYVGNYPGGFQEKDLFKLFKDYDKVRIEKMFINGIKTFAFVSCEDIDQVKSILKNLNGSNVAGRRLIIRPNKNESQEYMNLLPEEVEEGDANSGNRTADAKNVYHQKVKKHHTASSVTSLEYKQNRKFSEKQINDTKSHYFGPNQNIQHEQDKILFEKEIRDQESCIERVCTRNNDLIPYHSIPHEKMPKTPTKRMVKGKVSARSHLPTIDSNPSKCMQSNVLEENLEAKEIHWVSVTNFPIGISADLLYELFSDYNPIDVKIVCNIPRRDKRITEAYVGFPSEDIAFEVILNFDNTIFSGRVLMVEDLADPDLMSELISLDSLK